MNHFWQNLTSFTQSERRGTFVFVLILLSVIGFNKSIPYVFKDEPWYIVKDTAWINQWKQSILAQKQLKLKNFNPNKVTKSELLQMGIPASLARSWIKYTSAGGYFNSKPDLLKLYGLHDTLYAQIEPYLIIHRSNKQQVYYHNKYKPKKKEQKELRKFDPNTNTKEQLLNSGLSAGIANNIINYRKSGGSFKSKNDIKKLYAVDSIQYKRIAGYIDLPEKKEEIIVVDSIEINSATKQDFIQIKIKPYMVGRIIKYRNLLGGFYTFEQVEEIYNIDSATIRKLNKSSWIDTLLIKHININTATKNDFARHPYINHRQAAQIYKYQKFVEHVTKISEIRSLNIMNKKTYKKIRPYLEL